VVEAIRKAGALVEVGLGLRVSRRDLVCEGAEPVSGGGSVSAKSGAGVAALISPGGTSVRVAASRRRSPLWAVEGAPHNAPRVRGAAESPVRWRSSTSQPSSRRLRSQLQRGTKTEQIAS